MTGTESKSDPIFVADNVHADKCGKPPLVRNTDANDYVGYFQNQFGEQWVFMGDLATRAAHVRGGDVNWKAYEVRDGVPVGLIMHEAELTWVYACWLAFQNILHARAHAATFAQLQIDLATGEVTPADDVASLPTKCVSGRAVRTIDDLVKMGSRLPIN